MSNLQTTIILWDALIGLSLCGLILIYGIVLDRKSALDAREVWAEDNAIRETERRQSKLQALSQFKLLAAGFRLTIGGYHQLMWVDRNGNIVCPASDAHKRWYAAGKPAEKIIPVITSFGAQVKSHNFSRVQNANAA